MPAIDLHTHSSYSDGSLSPTLLVQEATRAGLAAISLTDHDTMAGVAEAISAGAEMGVEIISGIEISTDLNGREIHMLGYGIHPDNPKLRSFLAELQARRENRNQAILERLDGLGIRLKRSDLTASTAGQVGRPHIARQLVLSGRANSIDHAFRRFLGKSGRAYVAAGKFPAAETIMLIREAGGIAVLAHPTTINHDLKGVAEVVDELTRNGLGGIEVYYPGHNRKICQTLLSLAERWQLSVTGGSDYHGSLKPEIKLGGAPAMPAIPYRLLVELKERLKAALPPTRRAETVSSGF